jgi:hypothetical protein
MLTEEIAAILTPKLGGKTIVIRADADKIMAHIRKQDAALAEARPIIQCAWARDGDGGSPMSTAAGKWLAAHPAPKETP